MPSSLPGLSASSSMKNDRGASLIESLLVVVMVGIIIVLMANLPNAFLLMNKAKHLSLAREVVAKQIEDKRNLSYINLVDGTTSILDSRISLLPEGSGTVSVEDCDGLICTNAENIKKITVTVTWKNNNKIQTVNLTTFIGEGGLDQ